VFQRTPAYVVPHDNQPVPRWQQLMYRHAPVTQRLARIRTYWTREMLAVGFVRRPELLARAEARWRRHLEHAVADPELRARLTPAYRMGCKRIVPSNVLRLIHTCLPDRAPIQACPAPGLAV
jgi:cation diffusion facilitator CzcD-associated flavoprotein CzcO